MYYVYVFISVYGDTIDVHQGVYLTRLLPVYPCPQSHIIKSAAESDRNTSWWIKGDGVDVVQGLRESVRGQWSGDVDLNDGQLQSLYLEYKQQLKPTGEIGLGERGTQQAVEADLNAALQVVTQGLTFLHSGKQVCQVFSLILYLEV